MVDFTGLLQQLYELQGAFDQIRACAECGDTQSIISEASGSIEAIASTLEAAGFEVDNDI